MVAESAQAFEALERQADRIMAVFARAGYERVAPSILQPADIFLDRIGEQIRNRTYVFADPEGEELCLRPDLTIPVCRLHLARHGGADREARYAYNGPAFRYQPGAPDALRPREFRQAGIEYFGGDDKAQAEVEILTLVVEAVRAAGLESFSLRFGDLGLLRGLLRALAIPERWRERLMHSFWRPSAFHALLHQLAGDSRPPRDDRLLTLIQDLVPADPAGAEAQVAAYLERHGLTVTGSRSVGEIAARLLDEAADRHERPLSPDIVRLIERYLAISGPPRAALARIAALIEGAGIALAPEIAACSSRLELLAGAGPDLRRAQFSADFGRQLEYYSGFVFQIEIPGKGVAGQIAGGGRYDGLLRAIGAGRDVPAVGSAIHTERLLAAIRGALA